MKKTTRFLTLVILFVTLSACFFTGRIKINEPVTVLPENETCIGSFDEFAFSTPSLNDQEQEIIPPVAPWQVEAAIPQEARYNYEIALIRSLPGGDEIWLKPPIPSECYIFDESGIFSYWVYMTSSKTWLEVPAKVDSTSLLVDQLFITQDGQIWGRIVWEDSTFVIGAPVLSRYDEDLQRFQPVRETAQIPNGWIGSGSERLLCPIWNVIVLDQNDTFWFFPYGEHIYSFDTATLQVEQHASLADLPELFDTAVTPDGSIFFGVKVGGLGLVMIEGRIYQFFPETGVMQTIQPPNYNWPLVHSMLVDHTGRLWTGVFGWREPDGSWVALHPQMAKFLRLNKRIPLYRYYWPPDLFLESSDGRLWFVIPRREWNNLKAGIAWYDPETNEGCWFTTIGNNVAEDGNRNMWLYAQRSLYRYALKP